LEDNLAIGTTVYIKNDGLLTKLEPRYFGPYTVASITKCGNYKLKNTEIIILHKSYPLEKLKLTKETDNSDQIFTVEKILDDRIFRRQQQYLVKWKGFSESNNSWEIEENFGSMQPVQLYRHQKQHVQPTVSNQSLNVRRSKRLEKINLCKHSPSSHFLLYLILVLIFCFFKVLLTQSISQTFHYCDTSSNMRKINLLNMCRHPLNSKFNNFTSILLPQNNHSSQTFAIIKKSLS
jgi:hypothetical protein